MWEFDSTIAALASSPGPAARAIVRVSGRNTVADLGAFFSTQTDAILSVRRPQRLPLRFDFDAATSMDIALHLWPTSRSYTGQPMAELHFVGSPPLIEELQTRLFATKHPSRSAR